MESVTSALTKGDPVRAGWVRHFSVAKRAARKGRIPATAPKSRSRRARGQIRRRRQAEESSQ
jgi:nucleoid DNA-binding protein